VASKWSWLLVTLAVVVVSCLVPGAMLSQPTQALGTAAIVTAGAPAPSGSECAAASCNRGSPSSSVPVPSLTLAGTVAAGILVLLALRTLRRLRPGAIALPAGTPSPLLRPPQRSLFA
jgi:hypothetical protein